MSVSSEKIVALRNDLGWSQHKLSIVSGVSERTIQRIEQDGSTCSLETKLALAAAFDVLAPALSPISDETAVAKSPSGYFAKLNAPHIGAIFVAAYLLIASGFNFQRALMVFTFAVVSLLFVSSVISVCLHGFASTRNLLAGLRWNDRYPDNVSDLRDRVRQTRAYIISLYLIGLFLPHLVDMIINTVNLLLSEPIRGMNFSALNTLVPAGYFVVAVGMAEFWLRPYQHQMEKTLRLTL